MGAKSKTYGERLETVVEAMNEDDFDMAISLSEKLLVEFPDKSESYYLLAVTSIKLGDRGKAIKFMEEGFKLDSNGLEFARALAFLNA